MMVTGPADRLPQVLVLGRIREHERNTPAPGALPPECA